MLKKNMYFFFLILDAAIFLAMVGSFVFNDQFSSFASFSFFSIPVPIKVFILVVSIILFKAIGDLYRAAKEKNDFNEFGIRKKRAKQKLSSGMREYLETQQLAEAEKIVNKSALDKAIHKGSKNPEDDLKKLIGLSDAKLSVEHMKARMEFDYSSKVHTSKSEMMHMVFYGSPGTGKTTVARIVAGFLYNYGYIKYNKILEIDGNFLKSRNSADTERKVKMILSRAEGGILFVDEAYSLTQCGDPIGKQAIATLIKEMEDNPNKYIVIFAGYTNEMKKMLDANPGFRSRIKNYIFFPDYNMVELREIAIFMAGNKGFSISPEAFYNFDKRIEAEMKLSSWGNGRTVRNIIEESINNHAYNYENGSIANDKKYIISEEDINPVPPKRI